MEFDRAFVRFANSFFHLVPRVVWWLLRQIWVSLGTVYCEQLTFFEIPWLSRFTHLLKTLPITPHRVFFSGVNRSPQNLVSAYRLSLLTNRKGFSLFGKVMAHKERVKNCRRDPTGRVAFVTSLFGTGLSLYLGDFGSPPPFRTR